MRLVDGERSEVELLRPVLGTRIGGTSRAEARVFYVLLAAWLMPCRSRLSYPGRGRRAERALGLDGSETRPHAPEKRDRTQLVE